MVGIESEVEPERIQGSLSHRLQIMQVVEFLRPESLIVDLEGSQVVTHLGTADLTPLRIRAVAAQVFEVVFGARGSPPET